MNCTFSRNSYKNMLKLNEQSCLGRTAWKKLFIWRIIIPPKWDLTCVDVRSQLGEMNPFSYKRFALAKWNTPFCRDLTQVRRISWVGWFFSYKQLLSLHLLTKRRSSHQRYSLKKAVLRNFAKIFTRVWGLRPATLLKKRLWHRCFPVSFYEISNNTFTEHHWTTASVNVFWSHARFKDIDLDLNQVTSD